MKKILPLLALIILSSCDSIKQIEKNTTETNSILSELDEKVDDISDDINSNYSFLNSIDLLSSQVSSSIFLKREILDEKTQQKADNWYEFNLLTYDKFLNKKERIKGYYSSDTPELLYLTSIEEDTTTFKTEERIVNYDSISKDLKINTFDNPLALSENEWQTLLITSNELNLSGFSINNKTISLKDMSKYSFNFTKLDGAKFFKVSNYSPYTTRTSLNNYNCFKLKNSNIQYWELTNWFFTSFSRIYNDRTELVNNLFFECRTENVHFEDVTHEETRYSDCIFNNSFFEKNRFNLSCKFSTTNFNNCEINNSDFINSFNFYSGSVDSCIITGSRFLRNGTADEALFDGMYFTNTRIENTIFQGYNLTNPLTFKNSTFLQDTMVQGNFSSVKFINGSFTNSLIMSDFNSVIFDRTYFYRTTFKSFQSPFKLSFTKVDFSTIQLNALGPVVFEECSFIGCSWPSVSYLKQNGVRFINCSGAPYNSTN